MGVYAADVVDRKVVQGHWELVEDRPGKLASIDTFRTQADNGECVDVGAILVQNMNELYHAVVVHPPNIVKR